MNGGRSRQCAPFRTSSWSLSPSSDSTVGTLQTRPRCLATRWQTSVAPIIRTGCHPERMVPVYAQSESCGAMTMQQVGGYVGAQPAGGRPASISSFVPMLARDRTLDPVKDGVVRGQ